MFCSKKVFDFYWELNKNMLVCGIYFFGGWLTEYSWEEEISIPPGSLFPFGIMFACRTKTFSCKHAHCEIADLHTSYYSPKLETLSCTQFIFWPNPLLNENIFPVLASLLITSIKIMPEDCAKLVKSLFCLDFLFYFDIRFQNFPLARFPALFCQCTNISIMNKFDFYRKYEEDLLDSL